MTPYGADPTHWLNLTPSNWLDRYAPGWRQSHYGDLLQSRPADWLRWMQPPYTGAGGAPTGYSYGMPGHVPGHPWGCPCRDCTRRECRYCGCDPCQCHGRECRRCGCDPCECVCCIGDVDLVVYARVGEQRVIPIVVENPRRREKSVTVELSNWRTRGGGAAPAETVELEPKSFALPPCGERNVTIIVRVNPPAHTGGEPRPDAPRDVDDCLVVTADLTLVGCDHRPIRIAIAILPAYCDPFRISCGCGCC